MAGIIVTTKKNPKYNYKEIVSEDNIIFSSAESKRFLKNVGIDGEIILTPGHSDDSISLLLINAVHLQVTFQSSHLWKRIQPNTQ